MDPDDKSHPKFKDVADLEFLLYPRNEQMNVKPPILTRIGDAVSKVMLDSSAQSPFRDDYFSLSSFRA